MRPRTRGDYQKHRPSPHLLLFPHIHKRELGPSPQPPVLAPGTAFRRSVSRHGQRSIAALPWAPPVSSVVSAFTTTLPTAHRVAPSLSSTAAPPPRGALAVVCADSPAPAALAAAPAALRAGYPSPLGGLRTGAHVGSSAVALGLCGPLRPMSNRPEVESLKREADAPTYALDEIPKADQPRLLDDPGLPGGWAQCRPSYDARPSLESLGDLGSFSAGFLM